MSQGWREIGRQTQPVRRQNSIAGFCAFDRRREAIAALFRHNAYRSAQLHGAPADRSFLCELPESPRCEVYNPGLPRTRQSAPRSRIPVLVCPRPEVPGAKGDRENRRQDAWRPADRARPL
jgi:hypothetical protein